MDAMLAGSQAPKDVSLFVSSTFRDMQDERDALRDLVLPRLREFVRPYGIAADLVDLRWGVDTSAVSEEEQDAKVLEVCLGEIDRCEPFFVLLLGDRYGYVPEGSAISVTEQEIDHALTDPRCPGRMVCCLRIIDNPADLSAEQREVFLDPVYASKLDALRRRLRRSYPDSILEYSVHVEHDGSYDLDEFCELVAAALEVHLREELGEPPAERLHPLDVERSRQAAQARRLSASFVGREEVLSALMSYCAREDAGLLLVQAEAGAGKTALVARLATQLKGMGTVVAAFCGLGPEVSDPLGVMRYLVWSLGASDVDADELYHLTYVQLARELRKAVEKRAQRGPVTLLIDAVDQLSGSPDALFNWASEGLPAGCHVIFTALPGDYGDALSHVRGASWELPPFGEKDARLLVGAVCARNHKGSLPREVVDDLIAHACEGDGRLNPLYVSQVVRHLLMLGRDDYRRIEKTRREFGLTPIQAQIVELRSIVMTLPVGCEDMYEVLVRDAMETTGLDTFPPFLLALAASRWGLRVEDLTGVFGDEFDPATFAWFRQVLSEDFTQRGRMEWDFSHESFRRMIWHRHRDEVLRTNRDLVAPYLLRRARFTGERLPGYDYPVYSVEARDAFVDGEVMHHLYLADAAADAAGLLSQGGLISSRIPLNNVFLDGLADVCALELACPFEETFLSHMVKAMRGCADRQWYWFVLAVDRVGLFSRPAVYGFPSERRLSLSLEMWFQLGPETGSDCDRALRASILIDLGGLHDGIVYKAKDAEGDGQKLEYLSRARALVDGLDVAKLQAEMGFAIDLSRRLYLRLGNLYLSLQRYYEARACYEYYIESSEKAYQQVTVSHQMPLMAWGDLLAGYIGLIQAMLTTGEGEETGPLCERMVELLGDQKIEDLDANQLSHAISAWDLASASERLRGHDLEAARYAYESLVVLVRLDALWPSFLSASELAVDLIQGLWGLRARPLLGGAERDAVARLARRVIAEFPAGMMVSGEPMSTIMAAAGLPEDVVTHAYGGERSALLGNDNPVRRRMELDQLDRSYAAFEESVGNYKRSDEVLLRLERSLRSRLASPAGSVVGAGGEWQELVTLIEDIRELRSRVRALGADDRATDEELLQSAKDRTSLASRYMALGNFSTFSPLMRRELELFQQALDCCRTLKERGSLLYDPRLYAMACFNTGQCIELTATTNEELKSALSILSQEGVGAVSEMRDNKDDASRLLLSIYLSCARCCSHTTDRTLLGYALMFCALAGNAYQRISAKTDSDDSICLDVQNLQAHLQKSAQELYPDVKGSGEK